jgi:hypothetical protein
MGWFPPALILAGFAAIAYAGVIARERHEAFLDQRTPLYLAAAMFDFGLASALLETVP